MSRARHMHKAKGGPVVYEGKGSKVEHEAEEKKRGGKVVGKVHGAKSAPRLDKRKRGGRIGSDKSPMAPGSANHPFSSAAR